MSGGGRGLLSHSWGEFDGEVPRLTERLGLRGKCGYRREHHKTIPPVGEVYIFVCLSLCTGGWVIFESIEKWEGEASIDSSISSGRQTRIEQRRRMKTRRAQK